MADREYCLAQFHCHWGEDCTSGSEHLINGRAFAAEVSVTGVVVLFKLVKKL